MEETILKKASEMFLNYGFKSVTMDDIAGDLGVSKKTIYKFFKNKEVLVDKSTELIHQNIQEKIKDVCAEKYNAIQENFEIKRKMDSLFKKLGDSPSFQLKKYYPQTFCKIVDKRKDSFKNFIFNNIEKGISEGLYRKEIQKEMIVRLYFLLSTGIYASEEFTNKRNVKSIAIEYHIRAIATPKGVKELEKQLEKLNNDL